MKKFLFWQKWLLAVGATLVIFGFLMVTLSSTPIFDVFNRQVDPAFWGAGTPDGQVKQFQGWIYGVLGATLAGWGIFLLFITQYPFRRGERWAWNCLLVGLLAWYVLDTTLSLLHKVYFNVAFNTALLLLVLIPLGFTRKYFSVLQSKA